MGEIRRDNSRATEIIRQLRSFMRKAPALEMRNVFDLTAEVATTVSFLLPEAKSRGIVLRSSLTETPLPVSGNSIQLEQVLSNLILNALDAMSDTGQSEKAATVETAMNGKFAEVSVTDTGPGVPSDALEKIFDPFYSMKEHGMGMGLSIVRTILEAHGGTIEVAKSCHGGATFRVTLPLA